MSHPTTIIIVVFDGLQPAQITPELMPNLAQFARDGIVFRNHHPAYPTVTRVNAATIVTGCAPGRHGLSGNTFLARDFAPHRIISALEPTLQAIADAGRPVLLADTLADILGRSGMEYIAVGAGTSGNAYLHHPNAAASARAASDGAIFTGATIHPDFTLPRPLYAELSARFGDWPAEQLPNTPRLSHARRILTEYILPERQPAVALLWLSEPDKSQHEFGVGLGPVPNAIAAADAEFGILLDYLDTTGQAQTTDLFVLSDHGYSTINATVSLDALLHDAGFPNIDQPGGVGVANNGGSALFYLNASNADTARRLTAWLMQQPFAGAICAAAHLGDIPGALPAALVGCDGPRSPDLSLSFHWNSDPNPAGYPGQAPATGGQPGQGQHGSMSKHELLNVGLARGPSFRSGIAIDTPTGNCDIAPTALHLLGIPNPPGAMDGRILTEALAGADAIQPPVAVTTHRAASGAYRQEIQISAVGNTRYVDHGNRV